MHFDVPFVPDESYIRFLNDHRDSVCTVHYSLDDPEILDARYKLRLTDINRLIPLLAEVEIPDKYLLLNSRFHHPRGYTEPDSIHAVLKKLATLRTAGVLTGVVFADAYYLQALSRMGGEAAAGLEAVPSVNWMLDTMDKVHAAIAFVDETAFLRPGKIVLDRSLNRNPRQLEEICRESRTCYPNMEPALLVNEGCIYHCPFKPAHDALIALANIGVPTDTHRVNREVGCMPYFHRNPERLLKSPFIRPEDIEKVAGCVDLFKICGRTMGVDFLKRAIGAYCRREYSGNLIDLMDAMDWMADRIHVDNQNLPEDFWETVTNCSKRCEACGYCGKLFAEYGRRKPVGLKPMKASHDGK